MGHDWIFTWLNFTLPASLAGQPVCPLQHSSSQVLAESCHGLDGPRSKSFFLFLFVYGSFLLNFTWHRAHRFAIVVIILSLRVVVPGLGWTSELWLKF